MPEETGRPVVAQGKANAVLNGLHAGGRKETECGRPVGFPVLLVGDEEFGDGVGGHGEGLLGGAYGLILGTNPAGKTPDGGVRPFAKRFVSPKRRRDPPKRPAIARPLPTPGSAAKLIAPFMGTRV